MTCIMGTPYLGEIPIRRWQHLVLGPLGKRGATAAADAVAGATRADGKGGARSTVGLAKAEEGGPWNHVDLPLRAGADLRALVPVALAAPTVAGGLEDPPGTGL